jgi:uncharacterized integral membrane protein
MVLAARSSTAEARSLAGRPARGGQPSSVTIKQSIVSTQQEQKPLDPEEHPRRSSREIARTAGLVALAILITLFAVFNLDEIKVNWVFGSGHAPLIIVIVISLLVGIVLTYVAERRPRRRR